MPARRRRTVPQDRVLNWLLEANQPSIRYLTLKQLSGNRESDPEVRAARAGIATAGWAAEILSRRDPAGWWVRDRGWMEPRFLSTHWSLLALSDLGATRDIPAIRESCEYWMGKSPLQGGGVGGFGKGKGHHCYTANMARALIRFGYEDDPRVRKTLDWIVRTAHPNGGWTCRFSTDGPAPSRTLDAWEGLSALAAFPRSKWTPAMQACVERGAEYYLEHELHRQGDRYEAWYRFHWPVHYYYDLLVGLDVLTALGYVDDPRLEYALDLLRKKRRSDGRWNLDAVQPDPYAETLKYYATHPGQPPTPLTFEAVGRPSKMITLRALTVLSRVD
jgi:hypothetical protein